MAPAALVPLCHGLQLPCRRQRVARHLEARALDPILETCFQSRVRHAFRALVGLGEDCHAFLRTYGRVSRLRAGRVLKHNRAVELLLRTHLQLGLESRLPLCPS